MVHFRRKTGCCVLNNGGSCLCFLHDFLGSFGLDFCEMFQMQGQCLSLPWILTAQGDLPSPPHLHGPLLLRSSNPFPAVVWDLPKLPLMSCPGLNRVPLPKFTSTQNLRTRPYLEVALQMSLVVVRLYSSAGVALDPRSVWHPYEKAM